MPHHVSDSVFLASLLGDIALYALLMVGLGRWLFRVSLDYPPVEPE